MRALLAVLLLAPLASAQEPGGTMVHAIDHAFLPKDTNTTTGHVVLMSFGPSAHTFTADDGAFDVELPAPPEGEWTERAFVAPPGVHAYHCRLHANMTGVLRVEGAAAPPANATTTPTTTTVPTTTHADPGFEAVLALAGLSAAAAAWRRRARR